MICSAHSVVCFLFFLLLLHKCIMLVVLWSVAYHPVLCGLPFDTLLFTLLLFHTLYLLLFHDVWITCALLLTAHVWILRALLLALHVLCCWFVLWCLLPGGALLFTFLFPLINLLLLIDALPLNNQPFLLVFLTINLLCCFSQCQLLLLLGSLPNRAFLIEVENHPIIMKMDFFWIEIQWVSICLI